VTTRPVHLAPHADAVGDYPQLRAGGRKEAAQQPTVTKIVHPLLPVLGVTAQSLEYPGQLRGHRSFPSRKAIESHAKPQSRKRKTRKK
jgi:hypothetical protein